MKQQLMLKAHGFQGMKERYVEGIGRRKQREGLM